MNMRQVIKTKLFLFILIVRCILHGRCISFPFSFCDYLRFVVLSGPFRSPQVSDNGDDKK